MVHAGPFSESRAPLPESMGAQNLGLSLLPRARRSEKHTSTRRPRRMGSVRAASMLKLVVVLALLTSSMAALAEHSRPHRMEHDQFYYFAIAVDPASLPPIPIQESRSLKDSLERSLRSSSHHDIQVVDTFGLLDTHFLVRVPRSSPSISHSLSKRDTATWEAHTAHGLAPRHPQHDAHAHLVRRSLEEHPHIAHVEPQVPRAHLFKRGLVPRASPSTAQGGGRSRTNGHILVDNDTVQPTHHNDSLTWDPNKVTASPEEAQRIIDHFEIRDPGFPKQWHLYNNAALGHDINVLPAWASGITGRNITVALVDDGLDYTAQDLADKFEPKGSFDFNDHQDLPTPKLSDDYHGTRCAGEVAASINSACGVGVALDARVSGIRILSGQLTSGDEARAYMYQDQLNDIYSCSFGPSDDGTAVEGPSTLVKRAFAYGFNKGRRDLGSVYVFASGNGGMHKDDCNADGYANSNYTITIGAVSRDHESPWYAENCAAQLACTYSGGAMGQSAIYTTDVGASKCTDAHSGTSAAAPIGAGIFALALSARPDLSVRTLQYLVVDTAVPFNLNTSDPSATWATLPTGRRFSHKFGFGKLDAARLVAAARNVTRNVFPHVLVETPWTSVEQKIHSPNPPPPLHPEPGLGTAESVIEITPAMVDAVGGNANRTETIMVTAHIEHDQRGDVEVDLVSPLGVVSKLMTRRPYDTSKAGFQNWTFSSVQHWGEPLVGKWTLRVSDWVSPNKLGVFHGWSMQVAVEGKAPGDTSGPSSTLSSTATTTATTSTATSTTRAAPPATTTAAVTRHPIQSSTPTPTPGGGPDPTPGGAFSSSTAVGLVGGLAVVGAIAGGLIKAARSGRLSVAGARDFISTRFGGNGGGGVGYEFQTLGGDEREVLFEGFLDDDDDDVDLDSRSSSGLGGTKGKHGLAATAVSVDEDEDEEVMVLPRMSMSTNASSSRGVSPLGRG